MYVFVLCWLCVQLFCCKFCWNWLSGCVIGMVWWCSGKVFLDWFMVLCCWFCWDWCCVLWQGWFFGWVCIFMYCKVKVCWVVSEVWMSLDIIENYYYLV